MSRLEAALRRAQALNDQSDAPEADPKAERMSRALAALADTPPPVSTASSPTNVRTAGFYAEKLVVTERPEQSNIEQYRKLAATLHHAQTERQLKVVMVSSAVSGDGKALTSTNLALTLSESYRRRVLLIDADLRRPSVHEVFQVKNVTGLTDSLKAENDRRLPLIQASAYLSLLLAGRPDSDPMSGLTSGRMRRLIGEAAATLDGVGGVREHFHHRGGHAERVRAGRRSRTADLQQLCGPLEKPAHRLRLSALSVLRGRVRIRHHSGPARAAGADPQGPWRELDDSGGAVLPISKARHRPRRRVHGGAPGRGARDWLAPRLRLDGTN